MTKVQGAENVKKDLVDTDPGFVEKLLIVPKTSFLFLFRV